MVSPTNGRAGEMIAETYMVLPTKTAGDSETKVAKTDDVTDCRGL